MKRIKEGYGYWKNVKEADRLRGLQDKLLTLKETRDYIRKHGFDYPLFGEGSPSANDLMLYIYPQWADRIERALKRLSKEES